MERMINFDNNKANRCVGQIYLDFLDYAFSVADFFMLVYKEHYGRGYLQEQKTIMHALQKFKFRRRMEPSWPGTPGMYAPKTKYKIVFYRCDPAAKEILKAVNGIYDWKYPYPEDLAFFKGNQCWFYSTAHEYLATIVHATDEDLEFLEAKGLASGKKVQYVDQELLTELDETFLQ